MSGYVIAAHHAWNAHLAHALSQTTGEKFTQLTKKEELTQEFLDSLAPEKIFFPHWSYKIPASIYQNFECIIFHMTDLPFGRGGSPLQNLIVRGFRETQLSALRCVEEFDAGPIYLKRPLGLEGTAQEIFERASELMEAMIAEIVTTKRDPIPQVGKPTYFKRRTPQESNLAAVESLEKIFDYIRMLDAPGYPSAFLETARLRFEFTEAKKAEEDGCVEAKVKIFSKETP